jgi:hypothetical protein
VAEVDEAAGHGGTVRFRRGDVEDDSEDHGDAAGDRGEHVVRDAVVQGEGEFLVRLRDDDLATLVLPTGEKEALLADDRGIFFSTPHYDGYPTILVRLPKISEKELRELLTEAWRMKAPPRVLKDNPDV